MGGLTPSGTVLLLVTGERERDWAGKAALGLSAAWAAEGRRVVLADLHLESPILDTDGSGAEIEGLVDILLYGASLARVAAPARAGAFYVIAAGTYAPEPDEVYRNPRWKRLVAGFRDTRATLLLLVPAESELLPELAAWSSEAILLGESAGAAAEVLDGSGFTILAELGAPGVARSGGPGDAAAPPESGGAEASEATGEGLDLPPPPPRPAMTRQWTIALAILLLIVLIAAVVYVAAAFRPDLVPPPEAATDAAEASSASRQGELLPYSVQVRAFTSLEAALERLPVDQERFLPTTFFISPEEIQGVLYYRILAGMVTDTAAAVWLRDRLMEVGVVDAEDPLVSYNSVQFTPLAYDLGEFPTREAAMARADSLLAQQIPSYVVAVPYSDGSRRWQLYGGAFRDEESAVRMGSMLASANLSGELTVRTGVPTPYPE